MSEETENEIEEAAPEQIIETPDYNPQDAYHVRKWELAGKPDVDKLDGDGNKWKPFIVSLLQEDGTYIRQALPEAKPPTDADIAKQYQKAYQAAEEIIFLLMGRVAPTLVTKNYCTWDNVNAEGTKFTKYHREVIADFKNAGRHPDAGDEMYQVFVDSPQNTFPWVRDEAILAIFATTIPRNPK